MELQSAILSWSTAFANHGFAAATLARAAGDSATPVDRLASALAGRWEALDQLNLAIDRAALARAVPDPAATTRDRVFELAMARFDAMREHRPALRRLLSDSRRHPGLALCLLLQLGRSANTILGAADVGTIGPVGIARIKALAAILAEVGRVWESDDDPDLGATMAVLDRRLAQAERCALRLCAPVGREATAPAASAPDAGDLPEPDAAAAADDRSTPEPLAGAAKPSTPKGRRRRG